MNVRRIAIIAGGVVVLTGVAGYGILSSLDVDAYRDDIIRAAEDATGRKVGISGPLKLKVSLSPAIVLQGVTLSNAPWAQPPQMVSVGLAEAEIGLMAALTGTVQVNRLLIHDATISLTRKSNGEANWDLQPAVKAGPAMTGPSAPKVEEAKGESGGLPAIAVRSIDIRNLNLALDDAVSGQKMALDIKKLQADADGFSDPMKLVLEAVYNDLPISAKGQVGPIENLIQNRPATVDLAVVLPGIAVSAKGKIGQPMVAKDVDLKLDFASTAYDALGKAIGVDLQAVPPVGLTAGVKTFGTAGYKITDGVLKLAGQELKVVASADLSGKKPTVTAQISAETLDLPKMLDGLTPKGQTASTPAAIPVKTSGDGRVFPNDPLPMDGLHAANLDAKLQVGTLIVPSGMKASNVTVGMTLKDGLVNVIPDMGIGGGKLAGQLALDARSVAAPANLSVKLNGQDLNLGQIAADMGMSKMVSGAATTAAIDLKAHGKSVRDLMSVLDGSIHVETGKGEIMNAELRKAIGDWAMSGLTMVDAGFATREKTVLSCMVVRFPVKQGVARFGKGIAMETDALNLIVGGGVDLRTEKLDVGFDPMPQGPGVGMTQTTAGLVRLGGTLASPSVGLDAVGAGKAALKVGAAVATGGLSLLGGALLNEATDDPHPCRTARGETAAKNQSQENSEATQQKSNSPVDAVGSAVKGLFGN